MDATDLARRRLFVGQTVSAVLSGLPLSSMSTRKVVYILTGVLKCLHPSGALYQFTYGPRCPISNLLLERFQLKAIRLGQTFRNVPPAAVYRVTRRTDTDRENEASLRH